MIKNFIWEISIIILIYLKLGSVWPIQQRIKLPSPKTVWKCLSRYKVCKVNNTCLRMTNKTRFVFALKFHYKCTCLYLPCLIQFHFSLYNYGTIMTNTRTIYFSWYPFVYNIQVKTVLKICCKKCMLGVTQNGPFEAK